MGSDGHVTRRRASTGLVRPHWSWLELLRRAHVTEIIADGAVIGSIFPQGWVPGGPSSAAFGRTGLAHDWRAGFAYRIR